MSRWSETDLAQALANNPDLRLSRQSSPLKTNPRTVDSKRSERLVNVENEPPAPRKYRNQPTVVNGITFDSKKEAQRYGELLLLEKAGKIKSLQRQVAYSIDIHGEHICHYRADFVYQERSLNTVAEIWKLVAEDVKGYRTPVYKLKKKLVHAIFGIAIRET